MKKATPPTVKHKQPVKGVIFRKIHEFTQVLFWATYKGREVYVEYMTSGLYKGKWIADVWIAGTGIKDVDTLYSKEECPTIEDAIRETLYGACLLERQKNQPLPR